MLVSTFPLSPSGSAAGEAAQDGHPARYHGLNLGVEEYESLVARLMDTTVEAICGLEKSGRCIFVNRACVQLLGYEHPRQLIGKNFHELVHNRHEDGRPYPLEACRMRQRASAGEVAHVDDEVLWRRDGTCFPVEYWSYPILRDGRLAFILVTFLDISERRAQQRALAYQATRDSLTGLLNRGEFLRRLGERAHACATAPWTLVISNLDGFKEVNSVLGQDVGDQVLQEAARRFQAVLGDDCPLARWGGDEFVFVLTTVDADRVAGQVRGLLAAIREPFQLNELQVRISSSFGLALYPDHARDPDELIRCADAAMRRAKRDGLGLAVLSAQDREHMRHRVLLRGELRTALAQGQFLLHLQPKVVLDRGSASGGRPVVGFEALARWRHPRHGLIPPARFIPTIEVSDLIHPFTRWVADQAVAFCARLQAIQPGVGMAANVSARNLLDAGFARQIGDALARHGVEPGLLELEVTESAIMADPVRALEILYELRALGVRLSVDDFGTGYSSFACLNRLPVDALKLDRSFVTPITTSASMRLIVQSIIEMGHALGLKVIAEGIETPEALELLRDMGCDVGQGYLISRPMPEDAARAWLRGASAGGPPEDAGTAWRKP